MTGADRIKSWVATMDPKAYSGLLTASLLVLAFYGFGMLPVSGHPALSAFMQGVIWTACASMVIVGGHRIDRYYYAGLCMVWGGTTASFPLVFGDVPALAWAPLVTQAGFCLLLVRGAIDMTNRLRTGRHE